MKIISNISEMQKWQNDSAKIAFVPILRFFAWSTLEKNTPMVLD
jgi:hypothetical protein